jgi:hypothetical protein
MTTEVQSAPVSRWSAGHIVALVVVVALLAVGAGVGTYLIAKSGGEDLDAARAAGQAAGQKQGVSQGTKIGYARGFKAGHDKGYAQTYDAAYRKTYRKAFTDAGLDAPQQVDIPKSG